MDNIITSDSLIDIEQHFRVSAGPGAGKTHWLVNHVKNVLHNSDRLGNSKKIACITYTNVAVHTIINRLSNSSNNVVVSTIHSFLYKYVIKPYLHFIAKEYDFNIKKLDGHDEILIGRKITKEWISNLENKQKLRHPYTENQLIQLPDNINALINWLSSIRFKYDANNNLVLSSDRSKAFYIKDSEQKHINKATLNILEPSLIELKKICWHMGLLHHDDVLFFSYQLILKYPFILDILRAKFPYFFVDEFQDSNPIQVKILEMIGHEETIIGLIGDKAQSIYGFQGADPSQFENFTIDGIQNFNMLDNRRSSNEIIDLLNYIRPDFKQNNINNIFRGLPLLLVGDKIDNYLHCKHLCLEEELCTLSRKNIISNIMKREEGEITSSNLFQLIKQVDSNKVRGKIICSFVKAVEFARNDKYKDAVKEVKSLRNIDSKYTETKSCLITLQQLLNKYDQYKGLTLKAFSDFIFDNKIIDLAKVSRGKIYDFYTSCNYVDFANCVNIVDDNSLNRTIHKAKGAEFDNVMIILEKEEHLKFITEQNLDNEEYRILYVAASRAKKRLFISVPNISSNNPIRKLSKKLLNIPS